MERCYYYSDSVNVATEMNALGIKKARNYRLFKPIQMPLFSGLYLGFNNQSGLRNRKSKKRKSFHLAKNGNKW